MILTLWWLTGFAQAAAEKDRAIVIRLEPNAEVQYPDEDTWISAWPGMELREGDIVRCSGNGSMDIAFSDGSLLSIMPGTSICLPILHVDKEKNFINRSIRLFKGILNAIVEKTNGSNKNYTVSTRTVVAGIRGTRFTLLSADEQSSHVAVYEGSIEIHSPQFPEDVIVLEEGYEAQVANGERPRAPSKMGAEMEQYNLEMKRLEEQRTLMRDTVEDFFRKRYEEKRLYMNPEDKARPPETKSLYLQPESGPGYRKKFRYP